jgi:uncharacterized protein
LRFFDAFLADRDTGILDEPPVRLAVHDTRDEPAEVRHEREWPLARTQWRELYLHPGGRLSQDAPGEGAIHFHSRDGHARFVWRISEPLELSGPAALRLAMELRGASDCNLFIALEKWRDQRHVPFEGSYGFGLDHVSTGWLKLSHRALDRERSRAFAPVHTHTEAHPVAPGETAEAEIALLPSATALRAGDELHVVVRARWPWPRNPITGQFPAAYEGSTDATVILHFGGGSPARLLVPHIPR